jgi:N-acetyl-anhydromuramyl-L-alanine amidase AmpD
LQKPNQNNINFVEEPEKLVAAIQFKGWASDKKIKRYKKLLKTALKSESIPHLNKFELYGYNAPYEVFNRRNEIIVELEQKF